ncbi:hypothetical protein ACIA8K_29045 [Catenuloplanes sp. NPDC051500]|uniref:hypothetical protein n=1 Tax=Catenuloplanes sp. NPDC051500 TaxID=3363959 RepID=UPI0037B8C183
MAAVFLRLGDAFDPDSALARMYAWKGGINKKAAGTRAMSARLSALRVTHGDANGPAEVTGNPVDLTFGRSASQAAPDLLARAVMTLIRDAAAQLADQPQEVIAESVAARAIADSVPRRPHQVDPHGSQEH